MNHPELLWELARQRRNDLLREAAEDRRTGRRGLLGRLARRGPGRASASRAGQHAVGTLAMCA